MTHTTGFLRKIRHQTRGINMNHLVNKRVVKSRPKGRGSYNTALVVFSASFLTLSRISDSVWPRIKYARSV